MFCQPMGFLQKWSGYPLGVWVPPRTLSYLCLGSPSPWEAEPVYLYRVSSGRYSFPSPDFKMEARHTKKAGTTQNAFWHRDGSIQPTGGLRALSSSHCHCGRGDKLQCLCSAEAALGRYQTSSPAQFGYFPRLTSPRAWSYDRSANSTNQSLLHRSATCVVTQGPRRSTILCLNALLSGFQPFKFLTKKLHISILYWALPITWPSLL